MNDLDFMFNTYFLNSQDVLKKKEPDTVLYEIRYVLYEICYVLYEIRYVLYEIRINVKIMLDVSVNSRFRLNISC